MGSATARADVDQLVLFQQRPRTRQFGQDTHPTGQHRRAPGHSELGTNSWFSVTVSARTLAHLIGSASLRLNAMNGRPRKLCGVKALRHRDTLGVAGRQPVT